MMSSQGGVEHEDTLDRFFGCPRQDLAGSCIYETAEFMALIRPRFGISSSACLSSASAARAVMHCLNTALVPTPQQGEAAAIDYRAHERAKQMPDQSCRCHRHVEITCLIFSFRRHIKAQASKR
jgi:hypothetical protein